MLKFILIFFIVTGTIIYIHNTKKKHITPTKYIRITIDKNLLKLPMVFSKVFNKYNFEHTKNLPEADLVFFEKLTDFQSLYGYLPHQHQIYYSLACIDHMSSKSRLYELLANNLGVVQSNTVVPPTFLLNPKTQNQQLLDFANDINSDCLIFKSNHQQQKGIEIVHKKDLLNFDYSKYVVAQKLLLNTHTIKGRKINLRQYILVTCDTHSKLHFYAYNDGFVYYSPKEFTKTKFDKEIHITTGYGDRAFYKENPLTMQDFEDSLSVVDRKRFNTSRMSCLQTMFKSINTELQKIEQAFPAAKFNILGVDLHVTREKKVLVMEVNKGCDLTFKDSRDANLKIKLVEDAMNLVLNGRSSGFSKIS